MKEKNILLLTDYSEYSLKACRYAIKAFGVEVNYILFHVYRPAIGFSGMMSNFDGVIEKKSYRRLEVMVENLKTDYDRNPNDLNISCVAEGGSLITVIDYYVDHHPIDYIVMGTKGASGLESKLIGSNASNLVSHLKVPMLLVPHDAEFHGLKRVVLASEKFNLFNKETLLPLNYLAKLHEARIQLLHVSKPEKELVNKEEEVQVDTEHEYYDITHSYHHIEDESIANGIMDFTLNTCSQLTCIVVKNHDLIYRLFHKDLAESLTMHAYKPLLILKEI